MNVVYAQKDKDVEKVKLFFSERLNNNEMFEYKYYHHNGNAINRTNTMLVVFEICENYVIVGRVSNHFAIRCLFFDDIEIVKNLGVASRPFTNTREQYLKKKHDLVENAKIQKRIAFYHEKKHQRTSVFDPTLVVSTARQRFKTNVKGLRTLKLYMKDEKEFERLLGLLEDQFIVS